jgi:hypothetical protein
MADYAERDVDSLKVGFITFEKTDNRPVDSIGSTRIRARWLWEQWKNAEEWKIGKQYDVLIFQKVYWEMMMTNTSAIKILDLCDPDWQDKRDVIKYCELADAVTTSTPALAEYVAKLIDKPCLCIPDRVNLEEHTPYKKVHSDKIQNAVWFGYAQNFRYITDALPFLKQYNIKLTAISDTSVSLPTEYRSLPFAFYKYSYPDIHSKLTEADVAILPMRRIDYKGGFKSNNKVLTCAALKVPVIQFPEDFVRLSTKAARIQEAEKMYNEVLKNWDVKQSVAEYKRLLRKLCKN